MIVAVTGTPGTGKTTAVERLETPLEVLHLNEIIEREGLTAGIDDDRGSWIADLEAVKERMAAVDDAVIESHLAHHLDAEKVVVLRCRPAELERRLRERGEPAEKATENAEAEALDVILTEAVSTHGESKVYEIDTTDRTADAVAREIKAVIAGDREPSAGTVSFTDYL